MILWSSGTQEGERARREGGSFFCTGKGLGLVLREKGDEGSLADSHMCNSALPPVGLESGEGIKLKTAVL